MKKFRFRLERLLALREQAERVEAAALGGAMRDEARERDGLAHAQAVESRAAEEAAATGASGVQTVGERAHLDLAREMAARAADAAAEEVALAEARTQAARAAFGVKRRERRTVERLKEQRQAAWNDELGRDERRDMDDVALRSRTKEGGR